MDVSKNLPRQMYTSDSEVGRMKLQSVKENLYEATTKVVLYSIEMYTKKPLQEWVSTDLLEPDNFKNANTSIIKARPALEQGNIEIFDITNGCQVINDFVRKNALSSSRKSLSKKINEIKAEIEEIKKKEEIIERRKTEIDKKITEYPKADIDTTDEDDEENFSADRNDEADIFFKQKDDSPESFEISENDINNDIDDDEYDDDSIKESANIQLSEIELFSNDISLKNIEDITEIAENLEEDKRNKEEYLDKLNQLTSSGQNKLSSQNENEKESLNKLRVLRNTLFAHQTEDQQEISSPGCGGPEAGPLYKWASEILEYIKIIENRYTIYRDFDAFYASKEVKDKFDGCKVYVQRQIKELYVNQSSIVFEFAGNLYDKRDEEFNFNKLIEDMAINWETGIRYLTVVTNEDLPELNIFFKECLSGTKKYVDYYLIDRNALRDSYKKKTENVDYLYFKLLYHLNPTVEKIYWQNAAYTRKEFARQVLYKFIKVKNMFQLRARFKNFERFIGNIDIKKWCEQHLLSEIYFAGMDDVKGQKLAHEMEESIIEFCEHKEDKGLTPLYCKVISTSVRLYFYMGEDLVFSYTRNNGTTVRWRSLADTRKYFENTKNFQSYKELSEFVNEIRKSVYFKIWKNYLEQNIDQSESEE